MHKICYIEGYASSTFLKSAMFILLDGSSLLKKFNSSHFKGYSLFGKSISSNKMLSDSWYIPRIYFKGTHIKNFNQLLLMLRDSIQTFEVKRKIKKANYDLFYFLALKESYYFFSKAPPFICSTLIVPDLSTTFPFPESKVILPVTFDFSSKRSFCSIKGFKSFFT
jgi:hypothetical protein